MYGIAFIGRYGHNFVGFYANLEDAKREAEFYETRKFKPIIFKVVDSRKVELFDGLEWDEY